MTVLSQTRRILNPAVWRQASCLSFVRLMSNTTIKHAGINLQNTGSFITRDFGRHSFTLQRASSFSTDGGTMGRDETESKQTSSAQLHLTEAELRTRVLESALKHVPIYGWTRQAAEVGCEVEGLPLGLHSMAMPQGGIDLILYFYASRNERLANAMAEWRQTDAGGEASTVPRLHTAEEVDAFLYRALQFRLEQIVPVLPVWPQALGQLALPPNVPSSVGLLAQLVDEVWAQAGDRSTDMTWYAKRLGLAYVYNLTEVYMLQDQSPELVNSWTFLQSRLADLRSMKQMDIQLKAVSSMLKDGFVALGSVTCNILGLSRNR